MAGRWYVVSGSGEGADLKNLAYNMRRLVQPAVWGYSEKETAWGRSLELAEITNWKSAPAMAEWLNNFRQLKARCPSQFSGEAIDCPVGQR